MTTRSLRLRVRLRPRASPIAFPAEFDYGLLDNKLDVLTGMLDTLPEFERSQLSQENRGPAPDRERFFVDPTWMPSRKRADIKLAIRFRMIQEDGEFRNDLSVWDSFWGYDFLSSSIK